MILLFRCPFPGTFELHRPAPKYLHLANPRTPPPAEPPPPENPAGSYCYTHLITAGTKNCDVFFSGHEWVLQKTRFKTVVVNRDMMALLFLLLFTLPKRSKVPIW